MSTFRLDLATERDLASITGLIDQAAAWLRTKGTDQWAVPWPSEAGRAARIRDGLTSGTTWLLRTQSECDEFVLPVATVTLEPAANPKLWNEWEQGEPAVYVSRLVVNRDYAGMGLGARLMDWAGAYGARVFGAQSIRIDVWTTNTALHGYYRRHGFVFRRFCQEPDYPAGALFERPIDPNPAPFADFVLTAAACRCDYTSPVP